MTEEQLQQLQREVEQEIKPQLEKVDEIEAYNSQKVLKAFQNNHVNEAHFATSTGYGYNDLGRETIERIYSDVFHAEDALVRSQLVSGTHALTVALFGMLRPGDTLLSITGKPYDTLDEVIGLTDNPSSLKSYKVNYEQIDLIDNDFDYNKIEEFLKHNKVKVIEIQRSKGYSNRKTISIEQLEKVIQTIRKVDKNVWIMVDNCYCEFVSTKEPTEVGADIAVGSLIKNLGAGIATSGAYIVGKKELVELAAERLTAPGEGKEIGPSFGMNRSYLQGLYMAPSVVAASVKTAIFTSCILEKLGYDVEPNYQDNRSDIVQSIHFHNPEKLIKYCEGIQQGSAIDSDAYIEPTDMPGYTDQIIMASGSFTQGSSIELSCDGPIRPPYTAYQQGSLTYTYGKLGVMSAIRKII